MIDVDDVIIPIRHNQIHEGFQNPITATGLTPSTRHCLPDDNTECNDDKHISQFHLHDGNIYTPSDFDRLHFKHLIIPDFLALGIFSHPINMSKDLYGARHLKQPTP